jgi:hypothetical protein
LFLIEIKLLFCLQHLSYLLSEHIPLMTAKFHPRYDTVVLTDSEEGSEGGMYVYLCVRVWVSRILQVSSV